MIHGSQSSTLTSGPDTSDYKTKPGPPSCDTQRSSGQPRGFLDRFELVEDGREKFDPLCLILWQLGLDQLRDHLPGNRKIWTDAKAELDVARINVSSRMQQAT